VGWKIALEYVSRVQHDAVIGPASGAVNNQVIARQCRGDTGAVSRHVASGHWQFQRYLPSTSNELPCRYHCAARHGTVLVVGHHARSMKKSPRLDAFDSHYVAGESSRVEDTYRRRHRVIL
jgi:hypothetical protein